MLAILPQFLLSVHLLLRVLCCFSSGFLLRVCINTVLCMINPRERKVAFCGIGKGTFHPKLIL